MRVVVVTEQRLSQAPDGTYWTEQGGDYSFWARYLVAFDDVRLVARVLPSTEVPDTARRVDGEGVSVWPIHHYVGLGGYLRNAARIKRKVRSSADPGDGVLLRVPSQLGSILAAHRSRAGLPFAVEMVGDPYEVFAPGAVSSPLRPLVRRVFTRNQQVQARKAVGVAYVTERTLQRRYPHGDGAIAAHYSSIELGPEAFADSPQRVNRPIVGSAIVSVGSLEQPYKGIDVLLRAAARLRSSGIPVVLTHVGDGKCRAALERLAEDLHIQEAVTFVGHVPPGAAVRQYLKAADLFVLPSRTEGLPRALVEAMATGMPAIASTAGGSPELLASPYLVPPGDDFALATAISSLISDPARMSEAAASNLEKAKTFRASVLSARRLEYYRALRAVFSCLLEDNGTDLRPASPREV